MERLLWVCFAGALGSGARYLIGVWAVARFGNAFPCGTLIVNVVGCFLMAVVMRASLALATFPENLRFALATGFVISYPAGGWALLLYLGLVPTALAYVLFLSGIRQITATVASIVTLVEPLTSTMLAWLLFGEQLGPLGVFGAALLLGAIGLLYRGESRRGVPVAAPDAAT